MLKAKERPILMKPPMTIATAADLKKLTCRIAKFTDCGKIRRSGGECLSMREWGPSWNPYGGAPDQPVPADVLANYCPYGKPGDRLWVRESGLFCQGRGFDLYVHDALPGRFWVSSDGGRPGASYDFRTVNRKTMISNGYKVRPSIHMPRWACRIELEVVSFEFRRVQAMTDEEAILEGISRLSKDGGRTYKYGIPDRDGWPGTDDFGWPWQEWQKTPREAYAHLWDKINGAGAWERNDWVWAVGFKRLAEVA